MRIKTTVWEESQSLISEVPLVGLVSCGRPILAVENIEQMVPVPNHLVKGGYKYFCLRAKGNSMDLAGIEDGDIVLIRQAFQAENGDNVVVLLDDKAMIKKLRNNGTVVSLEPQSSNPEHKEIKLSEDDIRIQGIVLANISKLEKN